MFFGGFAGSDQGQDGVGESNRTEELGPFLSRIEGSFIPVFPACYNMLIAWESRLRDQREFKDNLKDWKINYRPFFNLSLID